MMISLPRVVRGGGTMNVGNKRLRLYVFVKVLRAWHPWSVPFGKCGRWVRRNSFVSIAA